MASFINNKKILLVGAGKMGQALLAGWLEAGLDKQNIQVITKSEETKNTIQKKFGLAKINSDNFVSDIVFFAVKPQNLLEILPSYKKFGKAFFISIVAGKTIATFKKEWGDNVKIARAMPNLPATINEGITVATGSNLAADDKKSLSELFQAVGEFAYLENENLLDPVTAISGSGPAYIYYMAECMIETAISLGLEKPLAEQLVLQTLRGSALLAHQSSVALSTLREDVTSKGGTTEAALNSLKNQGFNTIVKDAITAACKRAAELAK